MSLFTVPIAEELVTVPPLPQPLLAGPSVALAKRELVRFARQPNRVVSALVTPLLFWLLIGGGMGRSFQAAGTGGGDSYLHYFFPGALLLILLNTAVFSTISIIEDRREGFLQSVLAAPVPRLAIVLGKVLGGGTMAFGQGLIFLLVAPLAGIHLSVVGFIASGVVMLLMSLSLTALGFCIAWRMSSTQGFHAVMMLFLMPMWFMSGALFPAEKAPAVLGWVMRANPLTYGLTAMRDAMFGGTTAIMTGWWAACMVVSIAFTAALLFFASAIAAGRTSADLQ